MTGRLLSVVMLVALVGCAGMRSVDTAADAAAGTPDASRFSVLTYNVNWGCPQPDLAVGAIRDADADVVCLQETTPAWERHLRQGLSNVYPHMTFKHSSGAGGLAILSKRPFREVYYGRSVEGGWFPAWIVAAETPAGTMQLVNVHLRPPLADGGKVSVGAYLSTRDVRRAEIAQAARHVEPGLPTIYLGDFNENDGGRAVGFLRERGFTDALKVFDPRARTWEYRSASSPVKLTGRYDHVLHSTSLRCLDARVIHSGASDHYPIVATFENRNPR